MKSFLDKQHFFMGQALVQAHKALAQGEVPIGAVLVDDQDRVYSRAGNKVEQLGLQTAHAEVLAINKGCKKSKSWRLNNYWLYVTLEPCLMCIGLAHLVRLNGVVYGASSPLFGFEQQVKTPLRAAPHELMLINGVREQECKELLQTFFKDLRQKRERA